MFGRLKRYFHQKATWGRQTGIDEYGQPVRETDMIECRIEKRITTTKDAMGREQTSTITCYIEQPEGVSCAEDMMGGTINGMPIISVKEIVDAMGKIIGYEVSL